MGPRKPKSREEQLRELRQKRDALRKQLISRLYARDQFYTQQVEKAGEPELAFAKLTWKINELEAQSSSSASSSSSSKL